MIIASIGDVGIDHYINKKIKRIGGIAFNYAVKSNPKENDVYLLAPIGTEESAIILLELNNLNINIDYIQEFKGNSPEQKINLQPDGTRNFCGYSEGVLSQYHLNKETLLFLENADIIRCPLTDGFEQIFQEVCNLSTKGIKSADISQDYQYFTDDLVEKYADYFDIIFLGGSKLNIELISKLAVEHKNTTFVLTMGPNGSIAFQGKEFRKQSVFPVKKVDATGCGDTFQAVFTIEYLKHGDFTSSLTEASKHAAETLSYLGIYKEERKGNGF